MVHSKIYSFLNGPARATHIANSAYTAQEIDATIAQAEALEAQEQALIKRASVLLEGQGLIEGWDSDKHRALNELCAKGQFYIELSRRSDPFPVQTWQRKLASQKRYIRKLKKAIEALS